MTHHGAEIKSSQVSVFKWPSYTSSPKGPVSILRNPIYMATLLTICVLREFLGIEFMFFISLFLYCLLGEVKGQTGPNKVKGHYRNDQ